MPAIDCGFQTDDQDSAAEKLIIFGPTVELRLGRRLAAGGLDQVAWYRDDVLALVDTGAMVSCIDAGIAASFGLRQVGRNEMIAASGNETVPVFSAVIQVAAFDLVTESFLLYGLDTSHFQVRHRAIMGRDLLRFCRLEYVGATGRVRLELGSSIT